MTFIRCVIFIYLLHDLLGVIRLYLTSRVSLTFKISVNWWYILILLNFVFTFIIKKLETSPLLLQWFIAWFHPNFYSLLFQLVNYVLLICFTSNETFVKCCNFITKGLKQLPKWGKNAEQKIIRRRQNLIYTICFIFFNSTTSYLLALSTRHPRLYPLWLGLHAEWTGLAYSALHLWTIVSSIVLLAAHCIPFAGFLAIYHYLNICLDVYVDHFLTEVSNEFNQEIVYRNLKKLTDGLIIIERLYLLWISITNYDCICLISSKLRKKLYFILNIQSWIFF